MMSRCDVGHELFHASDTEKHKRNASVTADVTGSSCHQQSDVSPGPVLSAQQESWMRPIASWLTSTFGYANKWDTASKLITTGQMFWSGRSKISSRFLDGLRQRLPGVKASVHILGTSPAASDGCRCRQRWQLSLNVLWQRLWGANLTAGLS